MNASATDLTIGTRMPSSAHHRYTAKKLAIFLSVNNISKDFNFRFTLGRTVRSSQVL